MPIRIKEPADALAPGLFSDFVDEVDIVLDSPENRFQIGFFKIENQVCTPVRQSICIISFENREYLNRTALIFRYPLRTESGLQISMHIPF